MINISKIYNIEQYNSTPQNKILDKIAKNKNSYFLLNEKEKYDYHIIKKIFEIFNDDKEFLKKIYNDLTVNVKEDWVFEFSLKLLDVIKKSTAIDIKDYINNPNILIAGSKELDIKTLEFEIEIRKSDILNMVKNILKEDKSQIKSLGFTYIQYIFYYSETILNFFAQHFISQIFLEYDIEKYLHENYINFEEFLNKNNKKSLIMKFIFQKDEDLTNYVINHPILLNEITYAFDYIQKAWDYYVNRETNNIYESIYNKIFEYIKSKSRDNDVQKLWDMAYYAAYTSGILEPFFQFSVGIDEEYLKIKKSNCEQYTKNSDVNKTIDYLYFKKIIEEYLNQIPDVGYKTKRKIISK